MYAKKTPSDIVAHNMAQADSISGRLDQVTRLREKGEAMNFTGTSEQYINDRHVGGTGTDANDSHTFKQE